jgi:hypothetical protein
MGRTKNYKDFDQFVKSVTSTEELRFSGMSQEDYEKGIKDGKFNDVGWPTPKNGRRYSMSEVAQQLNDPENQRMNLLGSIQRPHPRSKHISERTREPQKIVTDIHVEDISFWQKLVNIFKSNKENMEGDTYEK